MSKLKINLNELSKDMDEILNMLEELDTKNIKDLNMDKFHKKADHIKQKLEKKYPDNLDIKK